MPASLKKYFDALPPWAVRLAAGGAVAMASTGAVLMLLAAGYGNLWFAGWGAVAFGASAGLWHVEDGGH